MGEDISAQITPCEGSNSLFSASIIYPIVFILALFAALTWLFFPGFHDYDLIHICYHATIGSITFWFPPLLGLAINGLYQIVPPLAAVFVISITGALISSIIFLISMWNTRYILGTALLVVIALHPFSLMSIIQPGRDALISTALSLAVSLQCLGARIRFLRLGATSVALCFIALAIRPELTLAILPIMIIGSQQSMVMKNQSYQSKIRTTTLLLPFAIILFLLLHSPLKRLLSPGHPTVSGSLYYTQLRDLFLIARDQKTDFKIDGFPESCALSSSEVQGLADDPRGRLDQELKKIRPVQCYSYHTGNAAKIEKVWRTALIHHPLSYVRGRGGDLLTYLGRPSRLRTFYFFTSFQHDEEVLKKCVGGYHLYPMRDFYLSFISLLRASGDIFITHGLVPLFLHVSCMGILLFKQRFFSLETRHMIWGVVISGLLHLVTFTMISPVTAFRYLRWFQISSFLAAMLVASVLLRGTDAKKQM